MPDKPPEPPVVSLVARRQQAADAEKAQRSAPVSDVVQILENWLAMAKKGQLRSFVAVGREIDETGPTWHTAEAGEISPLPTLGQIEVLKASMLSDLLDIAEDVDPDELEKDPEPLAEPFDGWQLDSATDGTLVLSGGNQWRLVVDNRGRVTLYRVTGTDSPWGTVVDTTVFTIIGDLSLDDRCRKAAAWANKQLGL